ncbi:XRE family transcriptional regulator [Sporosarcina sp. P21c]|uniref:helix-turn-helix domain-containing protein n=1 Tax=Sporosarcina TaxID=1569 RepID=UPI000A15BEC5|nr:MULTISPECIES: helix-turn-helix transcriptional regulator [Sporosarcina]ARJ39087.1 hypothetical protein SporoP8_09490 [Sporosarcina ureae]PIC66255.1 XRE family transcriptional regulator [Sporosarcina sp. P16a]PIC82231.1 XRE family transcriptional regulator [Sporosarcina sp. P1]PIC88722.1 XRE family transcriptional regulator [Sporosarcina sp. P21c]PIC91919.1 XRE family transcriptional regulator [Sporosarcina sp. P25]
MNEFGKRLRKLREQKKMTLRYLAERANLSYSFIASLEKGRYNPSRESICALASALDVDRNELLILAGFIPNDKSDQVYISSKDELNTKEMALEKLLEEKVSYNGIQLSTLEKNALLAFVKTMVSLKK